MGKKQKSKKTVKATAETKTAAAANVAPSAKMAEPEATTAFVDKNKKTSDAAADSMGMKTHLCGSFAELKYLTDKFQSMSAGSNSTIVPSDSESDDEEDTTTETEEKLLSDLRATEIMSSPSKYSETKYSRGEKKARRLLMKLDLKRVPNVSRVTMRKDKNVMLFIENPDVYQWPNSMTYICFGEVHVDNPSNAAAAQAAERYINDGRSSFDTSKFHSKSITAAVDAEDIDEDKLGDALSEKDIELVVMQAVCTRQAAIKALLKHNSDIVNAIMELTIGAGS